jgi:hypothetical protein
MATTGNTYASQPELDRNTGLPVSTQGLSFSQDQATVTGPRTDTSSATTTDRTKQAVSQATSSINTTPTALRALDDLINQLSTRSAVSDAELDAEFPKATLQYNNGKWQYVNPRTGGTLSDTEAKAFNARQDSQRSIRIQTAGVIQGGTPETQQRLADRDLEIQRNREQQGKYSKEAAFTDSQALMDKALHDALETALPQITAASEGSGTSKGSMRALLTQRAAETGAREGAALGVQTSVAYGGLSNQLASTLEMLTRSDPNSPEALLLQAILGSKGLVSDTVSSQVSDTTGTKNTNAVTNQGAQVSVAATDRYPAASQPLTPAPVITSQPQAPGKPFYAFSMGTDGGTLEQSYGNLAGGQQTAENLYSLEEE